MRRGMLDMMSGSVSPKLKQKLTAIKNHLLGYIQAENKVILGSEQASNSSSSEIFIHTLKFFTWYLMGLQDGANKSRSTYHSIFNQ